MALMSRQARLAALPAWQRIAEQKNCLGCHGIEKDKIAPAFAKIARRYHNDPQAVERAIQNGSRDRWPGFKVTMPPFKDLNASDLQAMARWILQQGR
jgi:cytochrome c